MDAGKVLYALAYGAPTVAFVLVCALIGHRLKAWRGLAIGAAIPAALLCFGRAYQYAESAAGVAGATQLDAFRTLLTALTPPTVCFGILFLAERTAADNLRSEGKWATVIATVAAIIICTGISLGAVAWSYGRLFPLDDLTFALFCWAVLTGGAYILVIDAESGPQRDQAAEVHQCAERAGHRAEAERLQRSRAYKLGRGLAAWLGRR